MITQEQFFKLQYKAICRYIGTYMHRFEDVEEVVADVIYEKFDEIVQKLTAYGKLSIKAISRWVAKRAIWDLSSRYTRDFNNSAVELQDYSSATLDTPEAILDIKQRLPEVPQALIEYEPFSGEHSLSVKREKQRGCYLLTNSDEIKLERGRERTKISQMKSKFLKQLEMA